MYKTKLKTSHLGATGLEITRVGFGAWAIGGGGWEFGWGPQQDEESIAAIHRAVDLGINWIDTAAAYGFGRSERVVGRALAGLSEPERPYVFTKAPREVAAESGVVFSMVTDDAALQAITSGPDGMLAGLAPGKVHIDMGTVSPQASTELAQRVRALGASVLDAPVSGSITAAEAGGPAGPASTGRPAVGGNAT